MTQIPKLEENRELHACLKIAKELGLTTDYSESGDASKLIVSGTAAKSFSPRFLAVTKKGTVQGNKGPDALTILWDKVLAADAKQEVLYATSKEKCDEVLALIPSSITSHEQLEKLCAQLSEAIEEAYPGVKIHHAGFGKGKFNLVMNVSLRLWVATQSILNRAGMIIQMGLLQHLQTAAGCDPSKLKYPEVPSVYAE